MTVFDILLSFQKLDLYHFIITINVQNQRINQVSVKVWFQFSNRNFIIPIFVVLIHKFLKTILHFT